jgi:hypothetical protein
MASGHSIYRAYEAIGYVALITGSFTSQYLIAKKISVSALTIVVTGPGGD